MVRIQTFPDRANIASLPTSQTVSKPTANLPSWSNLGYGRGTSRRQTRSIARDQTERNTKESFLSFRNLKFKRTTVACKCRRLGGCWPLARAGQPPWASAFTSHSVLNAPWANLATAIFFLDWNACSGAPGRRLVMAGWPGWDETPRDSIQILIHFSTTEAIRHWTRPFLGWGLTTEIYASPCILL